MHIHTTSLNRSETRSIAIGATPDVVHAFVSDARNLPRWAPDFAPSIRPDGERWLIDSGAASFAIMVRTSEEARTTDLLAATDPSRGAYTRVVPNGAGAELLFTLLFAPETPDADVAAQMAVVVDELRAVRDAVQSG